MKALVLLLVLCFSLHQMLAQSYIMQDGKVFSETEATIKGNKLVVTLTGGGDGSAEVSYTFAQIARLDWPEPADLAEARVNLTAGQFAGAQEKILPIYLKFRPLAKVSGSWWSDAALIRARAMLGRNQLDDVERAAKEIISAGLTNPIPGTEAQLILIELQIKLGQLETAEGLLADMIQKNLVDSATAKAFVLNGDIWMLRKDFEKALECYLQIPTFYGTQNNLLPAALLGSARAYRAMGETNRADRAYLEIITDFANTIEATLAKKESNL